MKSFFYARMELATNGRLAPSWRWRGVETVQSFENMQVLLCQDHSSQISASFTKFSNWHSPRAVRPTQSSSPSPGVKVGGTLRTVNIDTATKPSINPPVKITKKWHCTVVVRVETPLTLAFSTAASTVSCPMSL